MNCEVKITIVIAAYNVEEWFVRCIESVLRQTYHNLEIIIIDDGSTDRTGELVDMYAEADDRIVPVHQSNSGLALVRERGIKMAKGQYVGFVDGDDEIEPEMYGRLIKNALEYKAEISQCGILYCFYDGRKKPMHGTNKLCVFTKKEGYRELMQGVYIEPSMCNKLYKTELLYDSCLDASITNNEDLLRNAVIFSRANRSVFEDFCGYHYWRRKESMSNNSNAVQNGYNILKARKLIMDKADSDVRQYAIASYGLALIGVYNSLIDNKEKSATELKNRCKDELGKLVLSNDGLSAKTKSKYYAIMLFPFVYDSFYKIRRKMLYVKIHKQVKTIAKGQK